MVSTAFTQPTLVVKMPPDLIPSRPTLHNFRDLFTRRLLGRWTLNSAIVAVSVTVAQLFVASLAGNAFAKKEFIGRNLLFWLYIGSMMVPGQVTLIPRYILMARMHLTNTYAGLILPSVAAPLGVFLMKQFMQTIPGEIIDAGRIDGASEFGVFTRLIVPLSKPAMEVLGIFTFVGEWNDFLWPLVITNCRRCALQVGWPCFRGVPMAFGTPMGATYAAIPITLVFLLFRGSLRADRGGVEGMIDEARERARAAGFDPERLEHALGLLRRACASGAFPGGVVLVERRGMRVVHEAMGFTSYGNAARPVTVETVYDVASLTKPMATVTSVLRLMELGEVNLDDGVARYLPGVADGITLVHLLTHTGGLVADAPLWEMGGAGGGGLRARDGAGEGGGTGGAARRPSALQLHRVHPTGPGGGEGCRGGARGFRAQGGL